MIIVRPLLQNLMGNLVLLLIYVFIPLLDYYVGIIKDVNFLYLTKELRDSEILALSFLHFCLSTNFYINFYER